VEEAWRDAGVSDPDVDVIHAVNDAVTVTPIRAPYEQHLEVQDGELVKGSMKTGDISL
jgi:hypothetical protein